MATTTGGDQQHLIPQQVAVAAAAEELKACEMRLGDITEELKTSQDRTKNYLLGQEKTLLEGHIRAYKKVIESNGELSFAKAAKPEPTSCVG